MLDLGMPAEDVKEENEDDDSDTSSGTSEEGGEKTQAKIVKNEALASEVDELKSELSEAKQQIARLLDLQEAIARQVLPRSEVKRLFEKGAQWPGA